MHSIAWWPTVAVLSVAIFTDLCWRRIPNWLVLPYMAAGLVVAGCLHGLRGVEWSLAGLLAGGVLMAVLFVLGGMGAGDVKLCAALGAWIGPSQMFLALVGMGLAGGVMVIGWAACAGFMSELFQSTSQMALGKDTAAWGGLEAPPPRRTMPYGPAIAIGALLSFFAAH
jgi:prepilin peptidase CpaA